MTYLQLLIETSIPHCMSKYIHTHTCMHTYIHTYIEIIHTDSACMHTYMQTWRSYKRTYIFKHKYYVHICMYAYIRTWIHTYNIQTCIHTYIHTYTNTHSYKQDDVAIQAPPEYQFLVSCTVAHVQARRWMGSAQSAHTCNSTSTRQQLAGTRVTSCNQDSGRESRNEWSAWPAGRPALDQGAWYTRAAWFTSAVRIYQA